MSWSKAHAVACTTPAGTPASGCICPGAPRQPCLAGEKGGAYGEVHPASERWPSMPDQRWSVATSQRRLGRRQEGIVMTDANTANGSVTVVLVHGAFADGSSWSGVIAR